MKHNVIRSSMIVLLIGLGVLTASRSYAQSDQRNKQIELLSFSWGIAAGQTARISLAHLGDGSGRMNQPVIARFQILDTEGEVIAQSEEIRIEPGKTRFWDVPRDQIRAEGDPGTRRVQVRTRIIGSIAVGMTIVPPAAPTLAATIELIDPGTGRTSAIDNFANFQRFLAPPSDPPGGV